MKKFQDYFNQTSIIAPKRDERPFISKVDATCPFCLANEKRLEKIIDESWQKDELFIRIVPNRYPVTTPDGVSGQHDVVIDTSEHQLHPKDFSILHWMVLLQGIQKRWHQLMEDPQIQLIQVFKNFGVKAGASISHSHWQIIALEIVPLSMKRQYELFLSHHECYLCNALHLQEGFLVLEDDLWEIWVPPIPDYPYEVWIIPKQHIQHYGDLSTEEIKKLGKHLKYLLEAYHLINPGYDFNICMMSGDVRGHYPYHFYIKLVMRIGHIAGFEIATGCHVLSANPAAYADEMKKILKGMYK